jgi:6-phosphogluconolactonase (cycloisomerase 2 family)
VTISNSFVTTTTPPTTGTVPVSSGLPGQIYAFSFNSGSLTAVTGSPFTAGTNPYGIIASPSGSDLYATDAAQNLLLNYSIDPNSGGLTAIPGGATTPTGTFPVGASIDATGKYMYVSNYGDGTVSAYTLASTGIPAANSSAPTVTAGHGATCVLVDPSLNRFVFTTNFVDGSVSSATMNSSNGSLVTNENSPYPTAGQPTCVASIAHNKPTSTSSSN